MSPGCTLQVPSGVHLLSSPSPHAWYPFVSQAFLATAGSFDDIAFGIATAAEVAAEFSASVPAVILFKKFDEGRVDFTGAYTAEELSTFVSSNALPLVVAFTQEVRVRVLHVVKHQAVCVCVCQRPSAGRYAQSVRKDRTARCSHSCMDLKAGLNCVSKDLQAGWN